MSHFKMRQVTSRLTAQGFTVERSWVDAVSVTAQRVYCGFVLSGESDPELAAFDIDAAIGKVGAVITTEPGQEPETVKVLLMVDLAKLALLRQFAELQARLGVNGMSETAQAGTH